MKRGISLLLTLAVLLSCLGGFAFAADGIRVVVDNTAVNWPDARPFVDDNGRTLVPLRPVAEAMGMTVEWDSANGVAIFHGDLYYNGAEARGTMEFPIGKATATFTCAFPKTGAKDVTETVEMDTAAVVINDRTYAPVRYLAEAFGYAVDWDGRTGTVGVYSDALVAQETLHFRGNMDVCYNGILNAQYLEMTMQTEQEAKAAYEKFMADNVKWFAEYYRIVVLDREIKEEVIALVKEMYAKVDYAVDCGRRMDEDTIVMTTHIRPLNILVQTQAGLESAARAFNEAHQNDDTENMTNAERIAYEKQWLDIVAELFRAELKNASYLPECTVNVRAMTEGGYWTFNGEDLQTLTDLLFAMPQE